MVAHTREKARSRRYVCPFIPPKTHMQASRATPPPPPRPPTQDPTRFVAEHATPQTRHDAAVQKDMHRISSRHTHTPKVGGTRLN
ncbi:hypothetical protein P153DRAFT_370192 [Dothidotthia symphoricarpi CBS 119687]|uniref:Uncharacterized protein n=1 Tax=Dothidotthia symphoricarpi CBS 119687 TaxID=1392245 RepID=A0A6A6A1X4_9PLEO|nr:uncharacterized protein P153DRAFT_370192 [Dothidotthia symphoricarpi CBS 119687]KAF2125536.1 hypothetical protein P153DRAFT_370192 [Dothidotthia symphoricarpi CBS 119687]